MNPILDTEVKHMKTKTLFASTIVASSLLFATSVPVAAVPTTWYVAMTGTDSSTCGTQAAPCKTINYASALKAQPGDTVLVEPGIYDENLITGAGSIDDDPSDFSINGGGQG